MDAVFFEKSGLHEVWFKGKDKSSRCRFEHALRHGEKCEGEVHSQFFKSGQTVRGRLNKIGHRQFAVIMDVNDGRGSMLVDRKSLRPIRSPPPVESEFYGTCPPLSELPPTLPAEAWGIPRKWHDCMHSDAEGVVARLMEQQNVAYQRERQPKALRDLNLRKGEERAAHDWDPEDAEELTVS